MSEPIIKKKRSGWWKGLIIGLIVVVAVIGTPIAAIFIAFYDQSTNSTYVDTNETQEQVYSRILTSCLDDIGETEEVSFAVSERDFNQILVPSINEIMNSNVSNFINAFYLDITDKNYIFVIELKENILNIFKTKVLIYTEMEHIKSENIEEDKFVFNITNIKIGRVSGLLHFGKTMMKSFGVDGYINEFLSSTGLNMNFDLDSNTISYSTKTLIEDIFLMAGETQEDGFLEIFSAMVKTCINEGQYEYKFYENEALEMHLKLSNYGFNNEYCLQANEVGGYNVDIDKHISDLKTLIDNNIITDETVGQLLHYLIHGYEKTDDSNRALVDTLDLTCIGILEPELYKGDNLPEPVILGDVIEEQVRNADLTDLINRHLATITEDMLNDMVGATSIIGYSFLIPSHDESGHSKITYVVVDKFYINIEDDVIKAVARIDMNGFKAYLILEYHVDDTNTDYTKLILKPTHSYLGLVEAPDDLVHYFYKIIGEAFNDLDCTSFDKESGNIIMDLAASFNDAGNLNDILELGTPSISLIGENLEDDGVIDINF